MSSICKLLIGLLLLACIPYFGYSQKSCGFDHLHEEFLQNDEGYRNKIKSNEKEIARWLSKAENRNKSSEIYTIPVVVHVMYADPNAAHNISDEQIISGIQRLNDIYANSDGTGINSNIRFCLAKRSPDCTSTNGINRIDASGLPRYATDGVDIQANDTDGIGANRLDMFNMSRWNPAEYMNIWVVNEISNNDAGAGVQAFATFPGTHPSYDGVVILYNTFGYDYDNCNCFALKSYTDENEVLAHEVGHYLNLYHTFEGDNNGNSCPSTADTDGDKIADTPAHIRTFSCNISNNNCYPANSPLNNMEMVIHNYMGYASETCQSEFTQGQVDRMRAALETARYSLLHSQGCSPAIASEPPVGCTPQTTTGIEGNYGTGIVLVKIADLVAGSGNAYADGGYMDNWCTSASLNTDSTYNIDITTDGFYNEDLRVYIDYDNDGNFTASELVFSSDNNFRHIGTFTTPATVIKNTALRLRIISDHFQYNIDSGCYAPNYGQVEDFSVIFPEQIIAPPVDISAGNSLSLDGIDDYLATDKILDPFSQSYSIEFWCKPEGNPSDFQMIFDKTPNNFQTMNFIGLWHGILFAYLDKNLLYIESGKRLEYNEWAHIAYTWDGNVQRIYLNGMLEGTDSVAISQSNDATLKMGSFLGSVLFFKGQIDDLRIWDKARTATEIRENMQLSNQILNDPALSYFQFNNSASGSSISDYSGTNSANLYGSPAMPSSTINTAGAGISQTIYSINNTGVKVFQDADAAMIFTSKTGESDFTVTKKEAAPNTLNGITNTTVFDAQSWTILQSNDNDFTANVAFNLIGETLDNMAANSYQLYFRNTASDGAWTLEVDGASNINGSNITFDGITKTGQYMIAK